MAETEGSEQFTLKLTGNGIEIDRTISERQLAAVMNVLMGASPAADAELASNPGKCSQRRVERSLRQYLDEVRASRKSDQIVAIGHYMGLHEGMPTFSRDDIKERFAVAREPMPSNFPRDFGTAVKAGLISQVHQKAGHYYVTKTGIARIDRRFGFDAKD